VFDQGFAALINDLSERGLLKDTLVVAMGEFGRTPKINKDAGRDHWGKAGSLIFAGAGVRGGKVIGATDRDGAFVTERRCARRMFVSRSTRRSASIRTNICTHRRPPVAILDEGGPLNELYT